MKNGLIYLFTTAFLLVGFQIVNAQSATPIQTITSSKIDFNLIRCIGNKKSQTVEVTLTLVNHDPHQDFQFQVAKAIDVEGTEYKTYEIKIGSEGTLNKIYTDVPVKTVILFKNVLSTTKMFRSIPISYYYGEPGHTKMIEYKDVAIAWR